MNNNHSEDCKIMSFDNQTKGYFFLSSSNCGDGFASSKMFLFEFSSSGGTLSAPTGCSPRASVGLDESGRGFKSPGKPPRSRHDKYLFSLKLSQSDASSGA